MSYYIHIEETGRGWTEMGTGAKECVNWQAIPFGPWERYRRDLEGGRRVIVAFAPYGGWVWDLWAMLDCPVCLAVSDDFATAKEAMDHADTVTAGYADLSDDELIARNGIDAYAGIDTLKIVTVGAGKRCVMCQNDIVPGLAAEDADGSAWLWCGSCASRNPGAVLCSGTSTAA
jgi:hypothetical protein